MSTLWPIKPDYAALSEAEPIFPSIGENRSNNRKKIALDKVY
ncbi:hypothetical protein [Mesorhizobium amorphae]|uniref:Uncharacterized protein n=1 Tax=Mesorhizobium amorphae CCNWGS0123 TaxID=1082933 RepID=G6Y6X8_9HYPH|nr:hypothetical protein [Mesorhizobium amorphae]EHH12538.1 hypothetical protein MEA186_08468 [Mesorhizobium amorphae CCNWGS0123]